MRKHHSSAQHLLLLGSPDEELQISPVCFLAAVRKMFFFKNTVQQNNPEKNSHSCNLLPKRQLSNPVKKRKLFKISGIIHNHLWVFLIILVLQIHLFLKHYTQGQFFFVFQLHCCPLLLHYCRFHITLDCLCSLNIVLSFSFFISHFSSGFWQGVLVYAFHFLYLSGYFLDFLDSASLIISGLMRPFIFTHSKVSTN